jgi:RNA 3'-terminal phosphate cyclase (ATP)
MAFYRGVKLPLLARFGLDATVDIERHGYYPVGGGTATLGTAPAALSSLELDTRGQLEVVEVYSAASESLVEQEVADRQATHAAERLRAAEFPVSVESVEYVPADSPGSSLLVRGVYGETLLGADALGERGRPSEQVADLAVEAFETAHAGSVPVDSHMADQLLVFLALVGGSVRLPAITNHVRTNLDVLQAFGSDIELGESAGGDPRVTASPHDGIAGTWPD